MNSKISKTLQLFVVNSSWKRLSSRPTIPARNLTAVTSNAVHKLQCAVEQYRVENYGQELPSRCKKEIIQAADVRKDGNIDEEELLKIVCNIGASDRVSKQDLSNIISEFGDSHNHTISINQMLSIL